MKHDSQRTSGRGGAGQILALTWPIFIELLLQLMVGNADQMMVGWHDPNGVGAIGNANQITNLLLLVFSVVCTASMILISQYIGARDTRKVNQIYAVSLAANLVFGLAVSLFLLLFSPWVFRLMGVQAVMFEEACLYMRIIGLGMVFQAVYLTFTAFFRSSQMMKETMAVSVVMNCLNIGGNAILINGIPAVGLPALGVAGAAISSGISRVMGVIIIATLFRVRFGPVLRLEYLRPFPREELRRLLRIGIPTGGESVSYNLSQIGVQTVCNVFPAFVVNTRVYATMFANVTYLFGSAMSQACQVVVARLMGGGEIARTDRQVKTTVLISTGVSTAVSVVLYVLCEPVYRIFTSDPQVLALAKTIMLIEIPLEVGRAVNMVMVRALQACGDIRFPVTICVIAAWLVGVGGSYFLGVVCGMGLAGLWIAMALDELIRAGLFLWRWHGRSWCCKQLLEPGE